MEMQISVQHLLLSPLRSVMSSHCLPRGRKLIMLTITSILSLTSSISLAPTIHPSSTTLILPTNQFDSGLFSTEESHKVSYSVSCLCYLTSNIVLSLLQLLDESSSLLADFNKLLLGCGTRPSDVLLSAGVFPSNHLKTRLTTFRDILRNSAAAFLQAQRDIETTKRCHVAVVNIAHLRAILDSALEKRDEMDRVLGALFEKTKICQAG
ncbi:hypothetical protein DVH24_030514 [Malus domestica]|uniref:Uncharacterized protein n=1 Tax=Malus domestica TaxID=3750 RepID=A0A498K140_MALDO|nr:hypothetical protein DVH24_030514 [Malus domestica]